MSFSKYFCKQNHFLIKRNNYLPGLSSVFPNLVFPTITYLLLGKPEGKEKQGYLEYSVSRATALHSIEDLPSQRRGGSAAGAWGGASIALTPQLTERLDTKHNYREAGHKTSQLQRGWTQNTRPTKRSMSFIFPIKKSRTF